MCSLIGSRFAPPDSSNTLQHPSRQLPAHFIKHPIRSNLALSDFFAHDPSILANSANKTYYLLTAIRRGSPATGRAGVVSLQKRRLGIWDGPHLVLTVPDGDLGQSGRRCLGPRKFIHIAESFHPLS